MTFHAAMAMKFIHEEYFGRPSCPKCSEVMMTPEYSECFTHVIRHFWTCDACDYRFESLMTFDEAGTDGCLAN
jgi:C4-type Zn-finger protein